MTSLKDGESGKPSNEGSSVKLEGRKPAGGGGAPSKKPEGGEKKF